jgi:hypothetical protein
VLTTALLVILILGLGTHLSDNVRVRQEEVILHKLSVPEAHAYYELLKKRAFRVRVLRAVTLVSLALTLMAARRRFFPPPPAVQAPDTRPATPPQHTQAARALADAALARQAGQPGGVDPARLAPPTVSGDDEHPWIFDYAPRAPGSPGAETIRVYVDRDGRTELHRLVPPGR